MSDDSAEVGLAESQGEGGTGEARGGRYQGPRRKRPASGPRPPRRPGLHHPHEVPDRRGPGHRRGHDRGHPRPGGGLRGRADRSRRRSGAGSTSARSRNFPDGETTSIAVSGPTPSPTGAPTCATRTARSSAIWNRCAHLGCPVAYSAGGDVYVCPCHGGAYNSLGLVTSGPPPRPLDRFDVKIVRRRRQGHRPAGGPVPGRARPTGAPPEARLLVGRPFSINQNQDPYALQGPG